MKCLTVCQPFASLIMLPDDDDRAKRVENRTWPTSYRGLMLIHAGKSKEWLDGYQWDEPLVLGAILGICRLSDCVRKGDSVSEERWKWLRAHEHYEGPWCWVLTECRAFDRPIPWRGAQGIFDVALSNDLMGALKASGVT